MSTAGQTARDKLEDRRSRIGLPIFAAQYQQSPVPKGGIIIKREWIHCCEQLPNRTPSSTILQSWDPASKAGELNDYSAAGELNDYSACATLLFHQHKIYVADMLRDRFDFSALTSRAIAHARTHRANIILVEDVGVGTALLAELGKVGLSTRAVKPQVDKRIRLAVPARKFENGTVLFPRHAPWPAELLAELLAFPHTRHDDQVD
jgi:predicted phage terminase large subunit-like protein